MANKPLTEITIKNFKCFTDLHLEGFERVNLIGGKNNVGKTAFLEAVELNVISLKPSGKAYAIYQVLTRRQRNIEEFKDIEFDFINNIQESVEILTEPDNIFSINDTTLSYLKNILTEDHYKNLKSNTRNYSQNKYFPPRVNFIKATITNEFEMSEFYGVLVDLNKESFLNESLQSFDDNIIALKQRFTNENIVFKVQIKNQERAVLLSSLGDGVNRFIAILCAIWASQDGFLFIDEIENGIHYTNYPKLWNIIFQASKDANCQLFITTHSKECIQAFNDANTADEGAYFEFYKNLKKNKITAQKLDNQQLNYALSHDGRVRGE
ncbi:AAA family ATPase [Candidatus Albibeggiatoa sp. nov. NOAA]|uniref:AAA family ATPase n=1 Tax=Candidatus Albibeggiatoa sp. nov. NOAA TaxID=3162724 RepID=UPI0032FEC59E|nr:AAA family ATPase [Thiotrichaceae bacterium]